MLQVGEPRRLALTAPSKYFGVEQQVVKLVSVVMNKADASAFAEPHAAIISRALVDVSFGDGACSCYLPAFMQVSHLEAFNLHNVGIRRAVLMGGSVSYS